jgi:hydroxymethylpyrimidine/phosphomethylpyrimidine kinase
MRGRVSAKMSNIRNLLSIAGSDPSGGAGAQADLKTFAAFGCYGMAAITALTAQNTQGVTRIAPVTPDMVGAQIDTIFADIRVDAVKIGMIATPEIAAAVAQALSRTKAPIVLDPVLVASSGDALALAGLEAALVALLLPLANVVAPNLAEAAALTRTPRAQNAAQMEAQARSLVALGARAALVKGGHLDGEPVDVLFDGAAARVFRGRRIETRNAHGTGCALSSAIAARLAQDAALPGAVADAKRWLEGALEAAQDERIGQGAGPPQHFFALWREGKY